MSSNLRCSYITGLTLWAACRDDAGDVLDVAGGSGTFEAWGTAADYDITATEDNSMYIFEMDDFTNLAAGRYDIQVFVRADATAANTDVFVREFTNVLWDGSDIVYPYDTNGRVDVIKVAGTTQTANDNGADINAILVDTGTTLENRLIAIEADTDVIDDGTSGLVKIASDVAAVLVDTGTTIPATITTAQNDLDTITGATGVNLLAATQTSIDAIETDTNEIQGKLPAHRFMGSSDGADDDTTLNALGVIAAAIDTLTKAGGDGDLAAILLDTGTTLEAHLTDIKGTGFVKDTDSLIDLGHIGADGDTLKNLSDEIAGIATAAGQPSLE